MNACFPAGLHWKNFIDLNEAQSKEVLRWRNHPDIRKWMRTNREISDEEHLQFLEDLKSTEAKQYFLLNFGEADIGVIDFYSISDSGDSCFYGYYLNPEFLGASYGLLFEYWVAEFAFLNLRMQEIRAETKATNISANELHDFFGFIPENRNDDHILQPAVLTKDDWLKKRQELQPIVFRIFGG